jgi:hypothetical protein
LFAFLLLHSPDFARRFQFAFFIEEFTKENERPFPRRSFEKSDVFPGFLPIHVAFFGRVDLRQFDAFVVKENLHLVEQKLVRIGIGNIYAEMIDELFLLLQPFRPTFLADFRADFLPQFGRQRRVAERLVFLSAARAFEFIA